MTDFKICNKCKLLKCFSDFVKDKRLFSGVGGQCKQCRNKKIEEWRQNHLNAGKVRIKKWRRGEKGKITEKKWQQNNKGKRRAITAKYRASKLKAMPLWVERELVGVIYNLAASMNSVGLNVHVDHKVPLQGKLVCGLHCLANLAIIDGSENDAKCNKFEVI